VDVECGDVASEKARGEFEGERERNWNLVDEEECGVRDMVSRMSGYACVHVR
jgi:hypothetical protein